MSATAGTRPTVAALTAEAFGTILFVLAVIATATAGSSADGPGGPDSIGVALAAGVALIAAIYAFGPLSGGHFNPAVTMGLAAAGRFPWRSVPSYLVAQAVGGIVAATLVVLLGMFGPDGWLSAAQDSGFSANGWGSLSPEGFGMGAAVIGETLLTALLLLVVLGVTHPERATAFAGLATGAVVAAGYAILLPIDGASLNPARSLGAAVYGGPTALIQLWVFLVFPILGAVVAGIAYRALFDAPLAASGPAED